MLKGGRIIARGSPAVLCTEARLGDLYGAPVHVVSGTGRGTAGLLAACLPAL